MYGLYTFSLVLLLAAPGQVGYEAEERGFEILVGIGILVVGLVIIHALGTGSPSATHSPNSPRHRDTADICRSALLRSVSGELSDRRFHGLCREVEEAQQGRERAQLPPLSNGDGEIVARGRV